MKLPWAPLFTIERSNQPEITVDGVLSVWDGRQEVLSVGDTQFPLWSRSLSKPIQLLCQLPVLKQTYPLLKPKHFAMMLASHNGEPTHITALQEMLQAGQLPESAIHCPRSHPLNEELQMQMRVRGEKPKTLYHPCSGKHIGTLLALKAINHRQLNNYLDPNANLLYKQVRDLLGWLLEKDPATFEETVDGCGMPNPALSGQEMARLYRWLVVSPLEDHAPKDLDPIVRNVAQIKSLMGMYPKLVGGIGRLDTRLIMCELTPGKNVTLIAKEGADGLLGVGVTGYKNHPDGLGILVKLASGYNPAYLETLILHVLEELGLRNPQPDESPAGSVLKTRFHFEVPVLQGVS